ncbi:DUF3127 domain-containing protein [Phocaeicola abscessus]|uniref:DUF3127 domain-containing protein n=1 Tax=Phocaeicola abscessus TaxID=555313 RepID=UPI000560CCB5|nr:DUF3127 domain-containing protein [Phocaeicola abscessus]
MELAGKVIAILQPRDGVSKNTGNKWMVQSYVIETHDQYPKRMVFEVFGEDKIKQFNIQIGEEINVSFDIDARQWQDKWFNQIRAWKIDRVEAQGPLPSGSALSVDAESIPPLPVDFASNDKADDLPF